MVERRWAAPASAPWLGEEDEDDGARWEEEGPCSQLLEGVPLSLSPRMAAWCAGDTQVGRAAAGRAGKPSPGCGSTLEGEWAARCFSDPACHLG